VFLVSGLPTGTLILIALVLTRHPMTSSGALITSDPSEISLEFFAMLSLFDTALVAVLIRIFLMMSGEHSKDVFLGRRPVAGEVARGLLLIPVAWAIIAGLIFGLNLLFPGLHNVVKNPYAQYMNTPLRAGVTIVVVILAGGVREELQRGFILHRFEQRLGGAYVGLAVFTIAFGLGHVTQGFDAAIAVGMLGAIWGLLYIRRRSVVAPMVSHAGVDASQVLLQLLTTLTT
jgi:membrane protease YdiL (CAAX protease family)